MALRRIAFGAAALSAARVFQLGASFLTVPFMARLLEPSEFGLVAIAMAMVALTLAVSDAGLSRSLIRTSNIEGDAWSTAHWLIIAGTGLLSLLLALFSWPAALFFETPALLPVLLALSIIPLMQGFLELPIAALIKRENFMPLAIADFASALGGAAAAIGFGLAGFGAWALVAQNIVNVLIRAPVILFAANWKPRWVFNLAALGEHVRFARDTMGYAIMQAISRQVDPFVIGKALGTAPLGLYSVAFRIMNLPAGVIATPVQTALYPRLAVLQDKPDELRALVLAATLGQASLVFPAMAAAAAASTAVFEILLSYRWSAAGLVFSALAIAGMVQVVTNFNSSLLQAIGRTGTRLRLTFEFTILWAIAALISAQFGLIAVAATFSIVSVLYLPRSLTILLNRLQCSMLEYFKVLAPPSLAALGIVACHAILMQFITLNNWQELAAVTVETLAAYACLLIFGRRDLEERLNQVRTLMSNSAPENEPVSPG
jgi:O-antigen/teichoic acid export membrane protein